jgi:hypothetical protein
MSIRRSDATQSKDIAVLKKEFDDLRAEMDFGYLDLRQPQAPRRSKLAI